MGSRSIRGSLTGVVGVVGPLLSGTGVFPILGAFVPRLPGVLESLISGGVRAGMAIGVRLGFFGTGGLSVPLSAGDGVDKVGGFLGATGPLPETGVVGAVGLLSGVSDPGVFGSLGAAGPAFLIEVGSGG